MESLSIDKERVEIKTVTVAEQSRVWYFFLFKRLLSLSLSLSLRELQSQHQPASPVLPPSYLLCLTGFLTQLCTRQRRHRDRTTSSNNQISQYFIPRIFLVRIMFWNKIARLVFCSPYTPTNFPRCNSALWCMKITLKPWPVLTWKMYHFLEFRPREFKTAGLFAKYKIRRLEIFNGHNPQ